MSINATLFVLSIGVISNQLKWTVLSF